jgi:type I site-specific restriction endonuclease
MQELRFPRYEFSIRHVEGQDQIFDPVRKQYVALTPEEWVRQHVIRYLLVEKEVPAGLLSVESTISLFKTKKRYDLAAFNRSGKPLLVVECKSPEMRINQSVVDQVTRYNLTLQAAYIFITNGLVHIFLERTREGYIQITELPEYSKL